MGEIYRGESWYSDTGRGEKDPDVEMKEHLDQMNRLLAKLIEQGGDLPSNVKHALRAQIQAHLAALGLESLEDYDGLTAIHQRLYERRTTLPTPSDYPDKETFQQRLMELHETQGTERLSGIPKKPLATDVATYGQGDWSQLEGRGGRSAVDYLYDLGKLMSNELAYTSAFDLTDTIEIGEHWRIENGRHRALTLRILGTSYVEQKGMDKYIPVRREE